MRRTIILSTLFLLVLAGNTASAQTLTLREALDTALASNPSIAVAREAANAAGFRVAEVRAGYLPQALLTVGYKRATLNSAAPPYFSTSAFAGAGASISKMLGREEATSYNNESVQVTVTQTVYDFGKTGGAHDAARANQAAAVADMETAVETVRFNVILAYFSVLATQEALAVAQATRRQMEQHLEVAVAQVTAGLRQPIDATRARSDLASAELAVTRAVNANRAARTTLTQVMGVEGSGEFLVERPKRIAAPSVVDLDAAVQNALNARPEYRALRARATAAEKAITAARSGWFPTLAANAAFGYSGYKIPDMVYNWSVGATATWPFFSGLYTVNAISEAEASARSAKAALRSLELSIRAEIEAAVLACSDAAERLPATRVLVESATETLALAEGRYAAGSGSILEVADGQVLTIQARAALIQAEFDEQVAAVRLLKALGRLSAITDGDSE